MPNTLITICPRTGWVLVLGAGLLVLTACGPAANAGAPAAGSVSTSSLTSTFSGSRSGTAATLQAAAQAPMRTVLDQLVAQGKITTGQETAILTPPQRSTTTTRRSMTFSGTRSAGSRGQGGPGGGQQARLNQLVSQGIITQDQATAISSALQAYGQAHSSTTATSASTTATPQG